MAITFNCPCGKVLSSRDKDAGLKAICPNCGRRVVVPGQIQLEPAAGEQFRRAALGVDRWVYGHQRAIWVTTLAIGVLLAGLLVGYYSWWRPAQLLEVEKELAALPPPIEIALDPNADPEQWRTNFDSFAVAVQQAVKKNQLLEDKFTGQEIRWEVTYRYMLERDAIYFAEAEPLRELDRGILVWATLLPSQAEVAEKLRRGQKIVLRGTIGPVTSGRSAEHQLGYTAIKPIECTIEPVAPITLPPTKLPDEANELGSPATDDGALGEPLLPLNNDAE